MEKKIGDKEWVGKVKEKLPKKVKKRRKVQNGEGYEEYVGYVFPDDDTDKSKLKILEKAMEWKKSITQ